MMSIGRSVEGLEINGRAYRGQNKYSISKSSMSKRTRRSKRDSPREFIIRVVLLLHMICLIYMIEHNEVRERREENAKRSLSCAIYLFIL